MGRSAPRRTAADEQVASLLRTAKESLGLSVAFLSRLDGTTQHLDVVESSVPFLFREGATQKQETSFCQAALDGKIPAVMPDVRRFPEAMALPAARLPRIRSYVTVPVRLSDGELYGTFCAAGLTTDKGLSKRDQSLMDVLAGAAALIVEPGVRERARVEEIRDRLGPVVDGGGPTVVLQPIVDLASGHRVGAEALSRFPADWRKPPDVCFAEAHSVGWGDQLELLALASAADHLEHVGGYVAMNVSPATLVTQACLDLLDGMPLPRILLELSEHDRVDDYEPLLGALAPLRARGLRLAVDDVGAGFSSLRHIVVTAPDVIKLDRTLVDGVTGDAVLRQLVASLVAFGHGSGAGVVAEGIETAEDAATLRALGVDLGQGWHFGRPGPASQLAPVAASPVRPVGRPRSGRLDDAGAAVRHVDAGGEGLRGGVGQQPSGHRGGA